MMLVAGVLPPDFADTLGVIGVVAGVYGRDGIL